MFSIVIPTYEQCGHGPGMLTKLFETIMQQTFFEQFEIIIADNSVNDKVKKVCNHFTTLPILYYSNPERGHCENFNYALDRAEGTHIKLMCMDDIFMQRTSLKEFWEALKINNWVASNSVHIDDFGKTKHKKIVAYDPNQWEKNITGMPSVIAYKKCDLRFDVRLRTYCDMWLYRQLFDLYGPPGFIQEYTIGQRFWKHSASRTIPGKHDEDRVLIKNILNAKATQYVPGLRVNKIRTIP